MGLQSLFPPVVDLWIFKVDPTSILITKSLIEIKWEIKPPEKEGCNWTCDQLEELRYTQKYYLTIEAGCHDSSCDPVKLYGDDVSTPYLWVSLTRNGRKFKREIVFESKATSPNQSSIELVPRNYGVFETSPKPGCPPAYPFDTNTLNVSIIQQLAIWSFGLDTITTGQITDFYLFDSYFANPCGSFSCVGLDPGWYLYFSLGYQDLELGPSPIKIAPPVPILSNFLTALALQTLVDNLIKSALTLAKVPFTISSNGSIKLYGQILLSYKIKLCELICPPGFIVNQFGNCVCPTGYLDINGVCTIVYPYIPVDLYVSLLISPLQPDENWGPWLKVTGPDRIVDLRQISTSVLANNLPPPPNSSVSVENFNRPLNGRNDFDRDFRMRSDSDRLGVIFGFLGRSPYRVNPDSRYAGFSAGGFANFRFILLPTGYVPPSLPPDPPPPCNQTSISVQNAQIDSDYKVAWNLAFAEYALLVAAYVAQRSTGVPIPQGEEIPLPSFTPPLKPPYLSCP